MKDLTMKALATQIAEFIRVNNIDIEKTPFDTVMAGYFLSQNKMYSAIAEQVFHHLTPNPVS